MDKLVDSYENHDIYEIIETLNHDYISLRESRIHKMLNTTLENLRDFRIGRIFRRALTYRYVRKHLHLPRNTTLPLLVHAKPPGKVVVYSCIAGPYDLPREPFHPEPGIEYVLYTDQPKINPDTIWQYRDIPQDVLQMSSNGKARNEYIRTHPQEFFPEYDYSIYVDGNMKIMSDISSWASLVSPKAGIAAHRHAGCGCVYKEGKRNLLWKRGNAKGLKAQMAYYKAEGVPEDMGRLLETTVLVTDLRNPVARQIYDVWWEDFHKWNSYRDQMSAPYALWKLGIDLDDVGTLGINVWRNPKLRLYQHEMKRYHEEK